MFVKIQRFASDRVWFMLLMLLTYACIMPLLLQSQVARADQTTQACANGQQISMGKYYLFNNLWGTNTGTGEQCIWDAGSNNSSIEWSTKWNWSGQFQVKSYDSVVLGWHWQKQTTSYLTGLPLQLSSNQPVQTIWSYTINQIGPNTTFNIAYDLWLHKIPNPASDAPSDEIMLWLYKQGDIHPVGSPVATVNLDGTSWTLWEGSRSSWQVHTFVRDTGTTTGQSVNLDDFLHYLVANRGLSSNKYLTGVEAGSEVWLGSAELDTDSYSTDVGSVVGVSPLPTPVPTPTSPPVVVPSPTLTPTPLPTPASTPTLGVTPSTGEISMPKSPSGPVLTPTPAKVALPAIKSAENNWYVVFFFVPVPIIVAVYITLRRHYRATKHW
ncbi:MAG TPA: hypothetical protein VEI53_01325 [Ktedonobacteraceae bacterium]|nr:hypothetical protein [Ktedonobacteraceae bacterium]